MEVKVIENSKFGVSDTAVFSKIFENPIHASAETFDIINNYRGTLKYTGTTIQGPVDNPDGKKIHRMVFNQIVSPSLFNPYYSVQTQGITNNVPLLDTFQNNTSISAIQSAATDNEKYDQVQEGSIKIEATNDCSIANLVRLSKEANSILGLARYKYSDFMYCADVGKISNNHMITLRRFATPIGDNIFYGTSIEDKDSNLEQSGDIGRLITWFGTEDNKLEEILKYSVKASWKTMESKIQTEQSQESNEERGIIGGLVNLFSPGFNNATARGVAPSALKLIIGPGADSFYTDAPYEHNRAVNGDTFDRHKIYEPQDTIRSMEQYEGNLEFSNEFTLVFNYKLRGYDNINGKSAFLDLLANILTVTYRTGTFWPGEQRILGAPPNKAGWAKANAMINKATDAGGTFLDSILNGGNFKDAFGNLASAFGNIMEDITGASISDILGDLGGALKGGMQKLIDSGAGGALKGMIANKLGRPAVYAFDSLLTGDNTGLWHVTIGNPLNPIASMGNLIITNTEIQHLGPLGLDDFPTELKVTVQLKHARPRDSVDVQRMYTRGQSAIYTKIGNIKNYAIFEEIKQPITDTKEENNTTDNSGIVNTKVNESVNQGSDNKTTEIKASAKNSETQINPDFIGWVGENSYTRFESIKDQLK